MKYISIQVEGIMGSSIEQIAHDMWELSGKLNIMVCCDFNGEQLLATPTTVPSEITSAYWRTIAVKKGNNHG